MVECERDEDETTHARGLSPPGSAFNKLGQWMHPFRSQGPGLHTGSHENTFLPCLVRGGAKHELHSLGVTGGCEDQEQGLSNMALRANGLGASRRAAGALLPPFFSQKTQAPSQGRSLMLWQLSLLLHSWPLFPSLHVTSNSYSKAMSCREPST